MAYDAMRARLTEVEKLYEAAALEVTEAAKFGDLSEASEYDAAKDRLGRIAKEREMLEPVLSMTPLRASDSAVVFEEGSCVTLTIYSVTQEPISVAQNRVAEFFANTTPIFEGVVMFGGTLPTQDILKDSALSEESTIGRFLLGKPSGYYSIKVPGGFANTMATLMKSTEVAPEDIKCIFRGKV